MMDNERPMIGKDRIDLYGSMITALQTTLESRGWHKFRVNEWEVPGMDPKPVIRFNYAHLEWRVVLTVGGSYEHRMSVFVKDASTPIPSAIDLADWLEQRVADSPTHMI